MILASLKGWSTVALVGGSNISRLEYALEFMSACYPIIMQLGYRSADTICIVAVLAPTVKAARLPCLWP